MSVRDRMEELLSEMDDGGGMARGMARYHDDERKRDAAAKQRKYKDAARDLARAGKILKDIENLLKQGKVREAAKAAEYKLASALQYAANAAEQ